MQRLAQPMKTAIAGTIVILAHTVALVFHSLAHVKLGIFLGLLANVFIYVVIVAAPLVALILLWTRWQKAGLWLLFLSMLGSLLFGVYNHFLVDSPDHVGNVPHDHWGMIFAISAIALAIIEAAGAIVAAWCLSKSVKPVAG
jgi:hypothetical protein